MPCSSGFPRGSLAVAIRRVFAALTIAAPALLSAQAPTAPRITEQSSGVTALLQAAHAVSPTVVWASGHRGVVLRTVDGGTTWERKVAPGGDSLEFRDVHAINADTAWILAAGSGTKSRIYRTNDGGANWTLQFINSDTAAFYDCMSMSDRNRGIAYSDASEGRTRILRTIDGGANWMLIDVSKVPPPLPGEGAFAASGLCVVHADSATAFVATGAPGARLLRTTDGGATWTAINTPLLRGPVAGLTGMSIHAGRGIVVAADINRLRTDTSAMVVGITNDGGRTWSLGTRPPLPGSLVGVAWVPGAGRNVAVVSSYGGAFYTMDGARTWTTITSDGYMGATAAGRSAWLAGANGKILRIDW
jgi:photosystem II stability/assembly factor-like uncharacterized protein